MHNGEHPDARDPDAVVGIRGDESKVSVGRSVKVKKWEASFSSFKTDCLLDKTTARLRDVSPQQTIKMRDEDREVRTRRRNID
jgi:hypothetical protein